MGQIYAPLSVRSWPIAARHEWPHSAKSGHFDLFAFASIPTLLKRSKRGWIRYSYV